MLTKEIQIKLNRFDDDWKNKAKLFEANFVVCEKCGVVTRQGESSSVESSKCKCDNTQAPINNAAREIPLQIDVIVGNIKQEPDRHYVLILPNDSKVPKRELQIRLVKLGFRWKNPAKLFEKFFIFCDKCPIVARKTSSAPKATITKCGFCQLEFTCSSCRWKHEQEHSRGSKWTCIECGFKTVIRSVFISHYRSHSKQFSCETCQHKSARFIELKNHQMQHRHGAYATMPVERFECEHCACSCLTLKNLKAHERLVHKASKAQCDFCGKIVVNKFRLLNHLQIHVKIPCPICKRRFAKYKLKDHIAEHSPNALKFECDQCVRSFPKVYTLNQHKRSFHQSNKFHCDFCGKIIKYKTALKKHVETHVSVTCSICQKAVPKSFLKEHISEHSKRKVTCFCGKSFRNRRILKGHTIIVHKKEKAECDYCGKTFKNKIRLKDHMIYHFKLPCPVCKRMLTKYAMKDHIKQHSSSVPLHKCSKCDKAYQSKSVLCSHEKQAHRSSKVQCDLCGTILKNKDVLRLHFKTHIKHPCSICRRPISKHLTGQHMRTVHKSESLLSCNVIKCRMKFKNIEKLNDHKRIHIEKHRFKCLKCNYEAKNSARIIKHMASRYHP